MLRRRLVALLPLPLVLGVTLGASARGGEEPAQSGMCERQLAVGRVEVRAGCTVDERVSGRSATLRFPCQGGPAVAAFEASVFRGEVTPQGDATLSIETRFPFSDGCTWETKQLIQGRLASGRLAYQYFEQPLPGQRNCARGCVGRAEVLVR